MTAREHRHDKPLRLFYALWPDDGVRDALQALQSHVDGRRIQYGNLHATLAFLGNQPAGQLPLLEDLLTGLPRNGFSLPIDRLGYFRKHRIAWVGSHVVPEALIELQTTLARTLKQYGIAFDDAKDFKAHVTLARDADPPDELPFDPFVWEVRQIALVQSLQEGSRLAYRGVSSRALSAGD